MKPDETNPKEAKIRAAAYVRMSTDHQKYSTENQGDTIREYAARRGMEIVETYSDEGKSGLNIAGRASLAQMIADVESGRATFKCILVYDISRWGRYQDADEAAYYEFICRRAGVAVYYCAEQFENDGSLPSTVFKGMKREIADILNARGIVTDFGRRWTRGTVHQVLTNEKYIGNNLYFRTSFRLKQQHVVNPRDKWVRAENVYLPLVEATQFFTAQGIILARSRYACKPTNHLNRFLQP